MASPVHIHDLTRRTEATLASIVVRYPLLDCMETLFSVPNALSCCDLIAINSIDRTKTL